MDSSSWPYIAIIGLIALSAFFSGSEIAFASANKNRLKKAAGEKGLKEKTAYKISEDYSKALSSILIGNNLVNIAASSVATVIAMSIFGESSTKGPALATAIMTVLILIFGEISPKIVAQKNSDKFSIAVAIPLNIIMTILKPVNIVVMFILRRFEALWGKGNSSSAMTEEELVSILEMTMEEGVIDEDQSELLQSALEFSDITAQEILTPRVDMIAVDIEDSMDEIKDIVFAAPYSRIPVYEGTIDNIIGILYVDHFFKRLLDQPDLADIRDILMPPCFIHKTMKLPTVMTELKTRKMHLAIVVDEYGGTMGMVTMEDTIEQLVGEIWDETDEIIDDIVEISENTFRVNGDLSIYDFLEHFDIDDHRFDTEYVTVGGWAIEMLDGYPQVGDSFDYQTLHMTIEQVDDLRITALTAEVIKTDDQPEDE